MASGGIMKDSYIGGIVSSSFIPQEVDSSPFMVDSTEKESREHSADDKYRLKLNPPPSSAWDFGASNNQTDEDKLIHLNCTNINKTEEYNTEYAGLSILPWEEFVCNPRTLNDLFYAESNHKITYDPDEVNVFFHGKNVMPPTVGDISENGKSWNIVVENVAELRKTRTWLTERCSVFGVTLEYKDGKFGKVERAPCVVLLDPSKGSLGDKLYTTLTRAMDSLHNDRSFCIEINLNGCVERWCKRVLLTDCKAVGAKIIITNGEEYEDLGGAEDVVCCIFCFPVWAIQTCVYKLHRKVVYDDFRLTFDADDLFLHGAVQDSYYQRTFIFNESGKQSVFRTRCAEQTNAQTLQDLGTHKFVCVKKIEKSDTSEIIKEHSTTTFGQLVNKRKDKVIAKENKMLKRKGTDDSKYSDKFKEEKDPIKDDKCKSENSGKPDTTETVYSKGVSNKAFMVEDNFNEGFVKPADGGTTPRIPEIASILCDDEPGQENIELDIPSELKSHDSTLFSPRTASSNSVLEPLPGIDFRRLKENKSLTALCSFEYNGSDPDDDSDFESDSDNEVKEVKKNTLANELANIDKTITTSPSKNQVAKSTSELKAEEENKTNKSKPKDKPKMGKLLKDLTKTTTSANTKKDLPSKSDERYQQAKEKIKQEKKLAKLAKEKNKAEKDKMKEQTSEKKVVANKTVVTKNADLRDSIEYVTEEMNVSLELSNDETSMKDEDVNDTVERFNEENQSDNDNCVEEFNAEDSSTDGDDVEMIYQSNKNQPEDISGHNENGSPDSGVCETDDSKCKVTKVTSTNKRPLSPINVVAASNSAMLTMGMDNVKPLYQPSKMDIEVVEDVFESTDRVSAKNTQSDIPLDKNREKWNVAKRPVIKPELTMSLDLDAKSTDFEDDLDLADIDEDGNTVEYTENGTKPKVPPLQLNYSELLAKKVKRSKKRQNSNMRYLGSSVPDKPRKKLR